MEAKLNKKNQVVVTMSRGEAQRVAEVCDSYEKEDHRQLDASRMANIIMEVGIELWLK